MEKRHCMLLYYDFIERIIKKNLNKKKKTFIPELHDTITTIDFILSYSPILLLVISSHILVILLYTCIFACHYRSIDEMRNDKKKKNFEITLYRHTSSHCSIG